METREQILRRDFSNEFIAKMKNAIVQKQKIWIVEV